MENTFDLIVVGGGAAGLMAAGTAASRGLRVLVLERNEKTARKVCITGKGRCNLTNTRPVAEFLEQVRTNREFFIPSFRAFDNRATMRFFEKAGVKLTTERGDRVFPASGKAWDVADALLYWCRDNGAEIECGARVRDILSIGNKVCGVAYTNKRGFPRKAEAPRVILATGGASYPATGSTGDGYVLAHRLGHRIEEIRPSLVPLESSYPDFAWLKGLALKNVSVTLAVDGREVASEFGEMSFSDRGMEGATVLRLSRDAVDALIEGREVQLAIDLKSALDIPTLLERIERERTALGAEAYVGDLLRKLVPKQLVIPISKALGLAPKRSLREMTEEKTAALAAILKDFRLPVSDYRPFEEAVVTAGGIAADEVDPLTLQSRLVQGLYFAGELLDVDANTGGYNLQIAFSTGYLAGQLKT